ncbi:MAG: peptidoglycan-associated lipoprotein Pal [Desulfuromonadales bacterium]|jgi:peptidoglycan-associated lipoprotein
MKMTQMFKLALVVLFLASGLIGCATSKPMTTGDDQSKVSQSDMSQQGDVKGVGQQDSMTSEAVPSHEQMAGMKTIYFDFDQFTLSDQARATLADNAEYLKANAGTQVVIEGHCDERGSDEYNLALGESRALAAKSYLVSLGIDPQRLSVISYGEEKPAVLGSTESAWAMNRRAEFKAIR